MAMIEKDNFYV